MSKISIKSKSIVKTQTIESIEIEDGIIQLNEFAIFTVKLMDGNGSVIDVKSIRMDGDDYNGWGLDDDYVVNFILSKLEMETL